MFCCCCGCRAVLVRSHFALQSENCCEHAHCLHFMDVFIFPCIVCIHFVVCFCFSLMLLLWFLLYDCSYNSIKYKVDSALYASLSYSLSLSCLHSMFVHKLVCFFTRYVSSCCDYCCCFFFNVFFCSVCFGCCYCCWRLIYISSNNNKMSAITRSFDILFMYVQIRNDSFRSNWFDP